MNRTIRLDQLRELMQKYHPLFRLMSAGFMDFLVEQLKSDQYDES